MKRLLLTTLALIIMVGYAVAEPIPVACGQTLYGGDLAASGTAPVGYVQLGRNEGFFSVQGTFTGSGTLSIAYQVKNHVDAAWSPAVTIIADAVSGTVYPYPAASVNIFAGYQQLVITETTTTDAVTITGLYRCIQ